MSDPVDSSLPAVPRLRANWPALLPSEPPALSNDAATSHICNQVKLTRQLCDEACRIRDIQFDDPDIAVTIGAAR